MATASASLKNANPFVETVAVLGLIGHPLFWAVWAYAYPQPYDSMTLRLIGMALLVPLLFKRRWPESLEPLLPWNWLLMCFFNLPFFFCYLFLRNELSEVWMLSTIGAMVLLTLMVHWVWAFGLFASGALLAWGYYQVSTMPVVPWSEYVQYLTIFAFPLAFGSLINHRLQVYRARQAGFEKRLRELSQLNTRIIREQNELLSRFLSNSIVARLRRHQKQHGLDTAMRMITQQEQKFCGIMQADIRNFTRMFGYDSEVEVAQLVRSCFEDLTEIGQDIAVLKPVGDCIFVYCDDENGRADAVRNTLALAIVFVNTVERINSRLAAVNQQPLNFGIAVHAGEVVYGNLASDNFIDPTVIGINVNKTARLEELTKDPRIHEIAGSNAIILSKEMRTMAGDFIAAEDLVPLELDALGITLRDFPQDRKLFAVRRAVACAYHRQASEHIQRQRSAPEVSFGHVDRYSHRGYNFYYEMQGTGADTSWSIMIDLTRFPLRLVANYAARNLADLHYRITDAEGQWLVLSTEDFAGELDEMDVESRIIQIIEDLQSLAEARSQAASLRAPQA